ncbi:hypothetical protein H4219_005565 [Mycoemilia scoparia]|uniref:glucan 1,3-beta-glucosidase n=1 Tax=Mycoemilia scoparia TaxID=417184 RepID=A0A9W8DJL4_9FUNG|nr:hypothetical protein H4219_005565 [Mycoemilia scoparia]
MKILGMFSAAVVAAIMAASGMFLTSGVSGSPINSQASRVEKRFGKGGDMIRGVNLGGWLVIEPWIRPSLFKQFENVSQDKVAVDEWTFCEKLGKSRCKAQLQRHWNEWVTEDDIRYLASNGINHIRIPIGYWALANDPKEPYVDGQVPYLEKAIGWARSAGINVILDLHGAPGSQNGFDNSGRFGPINWLKDQSSHDRTLAALQELAKIAAKHSDTVDILQFVNEPANWGLDMKNVVSFYDTAYDKIRKIAPDVVLALHDSFLPLERWHKLRNPDWQNMIMDTHIYHVFDNGQLRQSHEGHLKMTKDNGNNIAVFNPTMWTITGEWSLATSDCARWLNGFRKGSRWEGTLGSSDGQPQCPTSPNCSCAGGDDGGNDASKFSSAYNKFLADFARAQISAYEKGSGWVFWNFKTEEAPQWSYIKGLQEGWIPKL